MFLFVCLYVLHKLGIINLYHFLAGIKEQTLGTISKIETGNTVTKGRVDMNTDTSRHLKPDQRLPLSGLFPFKP